MLPGTGCEAKECVLDSHAGMKIADRIGFVVPFGDIKKQLHKRSRIADSSVKYLAPRSFYHSFVFISGLMLEQIRDSFHRGVLALEESDKVARTRYLSGFEAMGFRQDGGESGSIVPTPRTQIRESGGA